MSLLVILGPTATGKTAVATRVAARLNGEILSADSRQIYRGMDIGTGKDLSEYTVEGQKIPYHLIDIAPAGFKYNLYMFQHDFNEAYQNIVQRGKQPILCGGTGLYIESVLGDYQLPDAPVNSELRAELEQLSTAELKERLLSYGDITIDFDNRRRVIRAIEIAAFRSSRNINSSTLTLRRDEACLVSPLTPCKDGACSVSTQHIFQENDQPIIFGIDIPRDLRRERITQRLNARLDEGMVDEVRTLIENGVSPDDLIYYGLEYKYVTKYVMGDLNFEEMHRLLEISIHQFAKRQMTWFRGMERRGYKIEWIDGIQPLEERVNQVIEIFSKKSAKMFGQ